MEPGGMPKPPSLNPTNRLNSKYWANREWQAPRIGCVKNDEKVLLAKRAVDPGTAVVYGAALGDTAVD